MPNESGSLRADAVATSRVPTVTACPSSASRAANVWPTLPVPNTAIRILALHETGLSRFDAPRTYRLVCIMSTVMRKSRDVPARDRILTTAGRLFYRDGFRAVGIDTIIAEAGVAKMTLYRYFPSKDELIVAYLEESNRQYWAWLNSAVDGVDDPGERLLGMLAAIERLATSPRCLGCTFQSTAAEFPDRDHPGHQVALAHKRAVRDHFADLAHRAELRAPEQLADQLLLLMDGAWVAARMYGPTNPAVGLADAARALIDAHG